MDLQTTTINGEKLIALPMVLGALHAVDDELKKQGLAMGLVFAGETTRSWRSEVAQRQLVNRGASKTMYSNHRRGTAIDVRADWHYINRIAPTMIKHGLVNDLAYWNKSTGRTSYKKLAGYVAWDGGHFNWKSNTIAMQYRMINELPAILKTYSDMPFDEHMLFNAEGNGAFCLVIDGEKRIASNKRLTALLAMADIRQIPMSHRIAVNKKDWDSVPTGQDF